MSVQSALWILLVKCKSPYNTPIHKPRANSCNIEDLCEIKGKTHSHILAQRVTHSDIAMIPESSRAFHFDAGIMNNAFPSSLPQRQLLRHIDK